jgi:hypothetical protein
LGWMPSSPPVPADVTEAMAPGLVHPGTWVMTRRNTRVGSLSAHLRWRSARIVLDDRGPEGCPHLRQ